MAGIYLHIPFCKQACSYCNFHFSTQLKHKNELITAMCKEIEREDDFIPANEPIESIYFGGGTPSLLTAEELSALMCVIYKKHGIDSSAEITLEANPDDVSEEQVHIWKKAGINRLSLGIQSLLDHELVLMNRAHNSDQVKKSIELLQNSGFDNISTDLIFGIPNQTDQSIENHLQWLIEHYIPHVSCYALTVEPKTKLDHQIKTLKMQDVDNDQQARQFLLVHDLLVEAGYEHYEISNYALPGMRSKHNSSYWQGKAYHGYGPSAHSYNGKNIRRWNIANNPQYMKSMIDGDRFFETETLKTSQLFNEYIMTRLRTMEGIHLTEMKMLFGEEKVNHFEIEITQYIDSNKLISKENHVCLTREGMLYADGIAASLFV